MILIPLARKAARRFKETVKFRFTTSNRYDQRGFSCWLSPLGSLLVHGWEIPARDKSQYGWRVLLQVGRGAGHIWGRSLFLGWRVRGGVPGDPHARRKFRIGFTQNANLVPHGFL